MRIIKLAIISFIFCFLLVTAMSLLVPSHLRLSKAINVKAGEDSIFALIQNKTQWPRWHPAFTGGVAVDSLLQKNGIVIKQAQKNDSLIRMEWQQGSKNPFYNTWQLHRYSYTDSVTLQWYMDVHLRWYPWEKFGSLFYEGTYGTMMQKGLENLKNILHKE